MQSVSADCEKRQSNMEGPAKMFQRHPGSTCWCTHIPVFPLPSVSLSASLEERSRLAFLILASAFLQAKIKYEGDFSKKKCPFWVFLSIPPTCLKSLWDQLLN